VNWDAGSSFESPHPHENKLVAYLEAFSWTNVEPVQSCHRAVDCLLEQCLLLAIVFTRVLTVNSWALWERMSIMGDLVLIDDGC
jgi:hypothetical protein